ncbi:MEDS domain-containing protein [Umezawaea beigongshangensis]|uniref:MEDS domain-containing protein n=1 Tax=Umezawaea beigongshangensis TaxID=2780383 RepID=UPI0018F24822|nr:MEDS domain-containing protein [Umezawaea beigongshangensis]
MRDIVPGDHLCLTFADDAEQRPVVTEYLSAGLSRGERVLCFVDRTTPGIVLDWLASTGVDTGAALLGGRLRLVPAADSYLASGRFDAAAMVGTVRREVDASLAEGFSGLRICGEMSWAVRESVGTAELARYEREVDAVFAGRPVSAVCQYDARLFGPDQLEVLDGCHRGSVEPPPLRGHDSLRLVPAGRAGRRRLRVIGTVDDRTHDHFVAALDAVLHRPGDVVLDLSALDFIDVAGLRALANAAARLGGHRRMRLAHPAPVLCEVVRLLGWDRTPGLVLLPEGDVA